MTVAEYIAQVPEDRLEGITTLRDTILKHLPAGFKECISYGMVGYVVPHSIYPSGYHCDPKLPLPFMSFANQKNFISFYHMGIYADPYLMEWFTSEFAKRSKAKLDMGKSCIRFKKVETIPFDLIGELVAKNSVNDWIATYEKNYKR
ncbi:MAG: DUF1801 domain-containing protein [Flavobacteriales bacterium]|nr:DUF1801 domain-containing protein [Flavobacteriales bacterium]